MPSKKAKITVQEPSLEEVFANPEFANYADKLIGVIKRHFRMIEGRNVESPEIKGLANKIIEERLR